MSIRTIDSIKPPSRPPRPVTSRTPQNRSAPSPLPRPLPPKRPDPNSRHTGSLVKALKLFSFFATGAATLLLLAFLGSTAQPFALAAIGLLIAKTPSKLIFSLALLALILLSVLQLLDQQSLAEHMAALVYACLLTGTIALGLEIRRAGKLRLKKHYI